MLSWLIKSLECANFLDELLAFPNGSHDDQVDCCKRSVQQTSCSK
jgi:phage terminase large subunit-like protein